MSLPGQLAEIADALAPLTDEIADLSINTYWWDTPSPPALDVYPDNPFQTRAGFSDANQVFWIVRARVVWADPVAAQRLLLRLLDPSDTASVEVALKQANMAVVESGVSGFTKFSDDAPVNEAMLGCDWRITTFT